MRVSERFALNEWLSDYPPEKTYDEVIDLLRDYDDQVTVWHWFEAMPPSELIENIDNTQQHFQAVVNNLEEGVEI